MKPETWKALAIFGIISLFMIKMVSITMTAIAAVTIIGVILLWEMTRE